MLLHREIWTQHRGPIPKKHVVLVMNGDYDDLRIENLACVPREGSPKQYTAPYLARIKKLEKLLQEQGD